MAAPVIMDVHASTFSQSQSLGAQVGGDATGTPPVFARREQYFANRQGDRSLRDASQNIIGSGLNAPIKYMMRRWRDLTGREPVGIINGVAGSALLQAADGGNGFWEVGVPGSLHGPAMAELQRVLRGLNLSPRCTPGRVYIHRMQGEQDGDNVAYHPSTVNGPLYQAALQAQHDACIAAVAEVPGWTFGKLCIYLLGRRESDANKTGWDEIREAQIAFAAANPATVLIVWDKCTALGPLVVDANGDHVSGWAFTDGLHYTGAAFRAMGQGGVTNLAIAEGLL